jgi:hypothetical protein
MIEQRIQVANHLLPGWVIEFEQGHALVGDLNQPTRL